MGPETLWIVFVVVSAVLSGGLAYLSKKHVEYKKYADILVTAIETAKNSKDVKKMVSSLVDKNVKVNSSTFDNYVQEVVSKVSGNL